MQPYVKYTSWVKSPWNFVTLNSLDLELGKIYEPCNSFMAKVKESQGTWNPKSQEKSRYFAKKIGLKPWRGLTQFCRIHSCKILFSKGRLKNLRKFCFFFQKSIYILKLHCLEFFWYSSYSVNEAGSALHVLHHSNTIKIGLTSLI